MFWPGQASGCARDVGLAAAGDCVWVAVSVGSVELGDVSRNGGSGLCRLFCLR